MNENTTNVADQATSLDIPTQFKRQDAKSVPSVDGQKATTQEGVAQEARKENK